MMQAIHGGNVWQIAVEYGIPASSLLDFSANINPHGLPSRALLQLRHDAADADLLSRYPDPSYSELRKKIAERDGVSPECILVGEGAEALIGSTIRAISPVRCLVPIPAFSEYARACEAAGSQMETIQLSPDNEFRLDYQAYSRKIREGFDCVIVNNPHNPSGVLLDSSFVLGIMEEAHASGVFLLVDEAFIDYAPGASIAKYAVQKSNVVVARSLTKFYGCPALRVGYLIAAPDTVARIARMVPTWPVTILAANSLQEAIQDDDYASATLRENEIERIQLSESLTQFGAKVFTSSANFLLVRLKADWPDSKSTRELMIRKHKIIVRNCDSYDGLESGRYIRVAVRTRSENLRLLQGLRDIWR